MPSMPYSPPTYYGYRQGDNIAALLMRQGEIAAQGARASGDTWSRVAENLGNIAGGAVQQYQEKKQGEKRQAAFQQAIEAWDPNDPQGSTMRLAKVVPPKEALTFGQGMMAFHKQGEMTPEELNATIHSAAVLYRNAPELFAKSYPTIRARIGPALQARGVTLPEQPDESVTKYLTALSPEPAKPGFTLKPGETRFEDGKQVAAVPAIEKPERPSMQALDSTTGKPVFITPTQAQDPRYQPMRTGVNVNMPQVGGSGDVKEAVNAMKEGTAPPLLPGRATKEYMATIAESHRQGYDLVKANLDWTATQKHLATLNGAQQTRLRQAVDVAYHSLDLIDQLADKWNGGSFPLLNKANLLAAKNGAYGKDAASIATQLEGQITDLTSELGNVYMGGNSPTDHALQLAGKNLSANWDKKVLKDMTALARQNLKIRANSMVNVGVAGASADNPYAQGAPASPATAAPTEEEWVRDPATGKLRRK